MKLSINKKIGFIVSISLAIAFSILIFVLVTRESQTKLESAKLESHNLSQVMIRSLVQAMSQAIIKVDPYINQMKDLKNLADLRITSSNRIRNNAEDAMDAEEKSVLQSGKPMAYEEKFNGISVFRTIEPIYANDQCNVCHASKTGETLAVVSVRYSLKRMDSQLFSQILTAVILGLAVIIITYFIAMHLINNKITKDLNKSISAIKKLSDGEFVSLDDLKRKDEIGELNNSVFKLNKSMEDRAVLGLSFAGGNFEKEVVLLSDKDNLGKAFQTIKDSLRALTNDAKLLADAALQGNLRYRADANKHSGEFKNIINGVNATLDSIIQPIKESGEVLKDLSDGNFMVRMKGNYKGEYAIIKNDVNALADSIEKIISDVTDSVNHTSDVSGKISRLSKEISFGSIEQTKRTADVTSAIEEMSTTILQISQNANVAAESSKKSTELAANGGKIINQTVDGMNKIAAVVRNTTSTINDLANSSDQIGEIVQMIDDIADQTNLLALNAAIEAARAGDQGRGFAVVADEVRKLAERTSKATKEIGSMIRNLQSENVNAIESIEVGNKEVEKGHVLTQKTIQSLDNIIQSGRTTLELISQVAGASEVQSTSAENISQSLKDIDVLSNANNDKTAEIESASDELQLIIRNLNSLVNKFRITNKINSDILSPGWKNN